MSAQRMSWTPMVRLHFRLILDSLMRFAPAAQRLPQRSRLQLRCSVATKELGQRMPS
jgi:hypothetical protein